MLALGDSRIEASVVPSSDWVAWREAMAVAIERDELSAGELRAAARRSKDVAQARRLLALALVLEGASRTEAAEAAGMDRQTLRDWVHPYNEEGIDGLSDRQRRAGPHG